ncbi:MAG: sec-independent translocase [Actinomycetota bacterium]|nr:sec-independent translocase [Actinomycetota bacterium]
MFDLSPAKLLVLAIVGIIVMGPDRLPGLAKDAARMIRTLRDMANGARTQLRDELGPEFADVDLATLNPRTAISRALLGDDADKLRSFNPRDAVQRGLFGEEEREAAPPAAQPAAAQPPIDMVKSAPLARGEAAPYDADAT